MIHDLELVDRLGAFSPISFDGEVFRATRKSLDPLAPSVSGGRWAPKDSVSVLYTSLTEDGALAELTFHWGQLEPLPSKPASLHRIALTTHKTLELLGADLETLGVDWNRYEAINYERTQQIGAAVGFLGCDGLIVPSARWNCDNLILFCEHHQVENTKLIVLSTEEVDWLDWGYKQGMLSK